MTARQLAWKHLRSVWLSQVAADQEITAFAFKVAYAIAGLVNDRTHEVWPEVTNLKRAMGHAPAISLAIALLCGRGHLERLTTDRTTKKIYRAVVKKGVAS